MTSIDWINKGLEVLGAISALCGALSHLPLGKTSDVLGEIGLDIAGIIKALRGDKS